MLAGRDPSILVTSLMIALAALHGCKSPGHSSVKEFIQPPVTAACVEHLELKLTRAEGIPHKICKREFDLRSALNATITEKADLVEVEFGRLTQEQFTKLQSLYMGEKSVKYDAGRSYTLIDFLPRLMQATYGKQFQVRIYEPEGGKWVMKPFEIGSMGIGSNCWNTAYEFFRGDPKGFEIFYTNSRNIQSVFLDAENSIVLKSIPNEALDTEGLAQSSGLRFGDILVIQAANPLFNDKINHVAIYIDGDIFFEKSNFQSRSMYRLVDFKTMIKPYFPANNIFEFRRLTKLPTALPSVAFNVPSIKKLPTEEDLQKSAAAIFINYVLDPVTGHYQLEPMAMQVAGFLPATE